MTGIGRRFALLLLAAAAVGFTPVPASAAGDAGTAVISADKVIGVPAQGTYRIHVIDVGTGLSVFVEGADFTLLFDAGSNDDFARGEGNRVLAYLNKVRPHLTKIDHLLLSHPHKDHSELMPDVLSTYEIGNLWDSGSTNPICSYRMLLTAAATKHGLTYHDSIDGSGEHKVSFAQQKCYGKSVPAGAVSVARGAVIAPKLEIQLGAGATMTFLHGYGAETTDFNNASLIVRLTLGGRHILLPGDAQGGQRKAPSEPAAVGSVEKQALDCCRALLASDVLVAGHHGSKTSSRREFLDAIKATTYVISAGPTKYGSVTLPDDVVVQELSSRGIVWRTDVDDAACKTSTTKIGTPNDGKPGGCDNVVILIGSDGGISTGYYRPTAH